MKFNYRPVLRRGEQITCLFAVPAYYSGYAGNPVWMFEPGTIARVHCVAPKVRIVDDPPVRDCLDELVVADYEDPVTGQTRRVSLNFCNIRKLSNDTKID